MGSIGVTVRMIRHRSKLVPGLPPIMETAEVIHSPSSHQEVDTISSWQSSSRCAGSRKASSPAASTTHPSQTNPNIVPSSVPPSRHIWTLPPQGQDSHPAPTHGVSPCQCQGEAGGEPEKKCGQEGDTGGPRIMSLEDGLVW